MSQLGMILPFYHKACGGQIKQERHPTAGQTPGLPPPLKYFCMKCGKFAEPKEVTEDAAAAQPAKATAAAATSPAPTPAPVPTPAPAPAPTTPAPAPSAKAGT